MNIKIRISNTSNRVDFTIDGKEYHTNKNGRGCWEGWDYTKQIIGTCDFHLTQKTRSGMRSMIQRTFGDKEV